MLFTGVDCITNCIGFISSFSEDREAAYRPVLLFPGSISCWLHSLVISGNAIPADGKGGRMINQQPPVKPVASASVEKMIKMSVGKESWKILMIVLVCSHKY